MTIIFALSFCPSYALCLPCITRQDIAKLAIHGKTTPGHHLRTYLQYLNEVAFFLFIFFNGFGVYSALHTFIKSENMLKLHEKLTPKVAPALIEGSGMGVSRVFLCMAFHTSSHLRDFLIISWT